MDTFTLRLIARIRTGFPTKFGLPRQSGVAPSLSGTVVFEPPYRDAEALRGLDGYSHLWLIWGFSAGFSAGSARDWSPTVRPPRLGGNTRMGVFATRSPNRPNPLGLSLVKLEEICTDTPDGPVLFVSGVDMMDGTPIYDIKPYLSHIESVPDAAGGFAMEQSGSRLSVEIPEALSAALPADYITALTEILRDDPRPSYQHDPERVYGFPFGGYEVSFRVVESTAVVCAIRPIT